MERASESDGGSERDIKNKTLLKKSGEEQINKNSSNRTGRFSDQLVQLSRNGGRTEWLKLIEQNRGGGKEDKKKMPGIQ